MYNQNKSDKRYMPGLDGLRTLAVFFVVLYHLNVDWAPGGLLGVSIFFVLSGYLITDLLTSEWSRSQTIHLKVFWLRRCRRLLPAMFVMLAAVCAWVTLFKPSQMSVLRGDAVSSLLYANNWYLIFHQVSYFEKFGPISPLGHMWSLAVEEQFYLVWPLLLLLGMKLLKRRGPLFLAILAAAAISALLMLFLYDPGNDPSRVYYGTDTRAFSLLIGAALSIVWPSRKLSATIPLKSRLVLDGLGLAALAAVFIMVWTTNEYAAFLYPAGLWILSMLAALIIASASHPASLVGKLLGMKPLRWLGVRTYSIYIWHYPVIILTSKTNTEPEIWRALLQSAACVFLASISYKYIEEPIRGGLIGRAWNRIRKGQASLTLVPLKGWITSASVLLLIVISCTGFALHTQVNASMIPQEAAPVSAVQAPSSDTNLQDGSSDQTQGEHATAAASEVSPGEGAAAEQPHSVEAGRSDSQKASTPVTSETPVKAGGSGHDSTPSQPSGASVPAAKDGKASIPVTAIGDSILLDAQSHLSKLIPGAVIDGKIGRQMADAEMLISDLRSEGKLGDLVVIELGTNGPFSSKQLGSLLRSLQDVRTIVLVNARVPRSWEGSVNAALKKAAASYPNTKLLDWHAASKGKSYFEPDGVHLKPQGGKALADLIAKELGYKD
ncbi:acyltransferase family protein [Paenibacillus sp. SAF-054]|uniref:acyltransferase family protein n=1 Tax=unclassified Paenibacillus TaxID=185978 RepID=UPI003F8154A2